MKYFFLIIYSILLPVLSLKKTIPKLCINCKFFINSVSGDNKHGKCSLFPKEENILNFLVSGVNDNDYYHCSITRKYDDMCGKEGKKYKKKLSNNRHFTPLDI
jgi:hypothetical protein